jgi:radical SAM superfamily enzyme YgiQ (UPF0313 family)
LNSHKRVVFPLALAEHAWGLPYLALGMITAYLRQYQDGQLTRNYEIMRLSPAGIKGYTLQEVYGRVSGHRDPVCLFSSYVWNHDINMRAAQRIKRQAPGALVVVGGPEVPKYVGATEAFLHAHPYIDIAVLGEGEVACAEVLEQLSPPQGGSLVDIIGEVTGLVFRDGEELHRTGERQRLKNLDDLPSPYLSGEFEPWFRNFSNAIIETNRGCPYGCTYCDWGSATLQKVKLFDPERAIAEAEYIAGTSAEAIFIADANFGMLEQDIEIAKALVEIRKRTGFPRRLNSNFAKNGGRRLMEVIRILHEGGLLPTGILALQTTDASVLKAIRRDNIKTGSYVKQMEYFSDRNIPIATDIMIGLPGQTVQSLATDLQFCFDWKVSAHCNYTSMMPNAPMAKPAYMAEYEITVDSDGLIDSTRSFSRGDMEYMKCLDINYQFHVRLGVLRYYLYHLQVEYGVAAIGFLERWLNGVLDGAPGLDISRQLYHEVFAMESRRGDWALISWGNEAEFLPL